MVKTVCKTSSSKVRKYKDGSTKTFTKVKVSPTKSVWKKTGSSRP